MLCRIQQAVDALQRGELPLSVLLPAAWIEAACQLAGYSDRGRVYTPVTTVLTWVGQLISDRGSCQRAVQALIAHQTVHDQTPSSADTGGYCKARKRVPESVCWELMRRIGHELEQQVPQAWCWQGRNVRVVDGSTVRIADTAANRAVYPLQKRLKEGLSYPVVRILVVFSFAVGTVLEAAICPYQGKGTGETAMLRGLAGRFQPGDVLLGDRYFAGYWDIAFWLLRGIDMVVRNSASRKANFRTGERLGKDDHIIEWKRTARPDWVDPKTAGLFPLVLRLREVRVRVTQPGFRTEEVILITTLLDPIAFPAEALAALYRRRWDAELNLRSLKTQMRMEQLRCKTPEMLRKEFAMYLTAYDCLRNQAAVAAEHSGTLQPWELSFQGTRDAINEFFPRMTPPAQRHAWLNQLLVTILQIQVGHRPNRLEPYVNKTRPKDFPPPKETRHEYRSRIVGT